MPTPPVLKVVVTHRAAARAKYGASGWRRIRRAVTELATADKARGLTTRFFALDSAADAKKVGATAVASANDAAAAKASIDRIFAAWAPAYLLLLGGPELVPQPALANPLWTGDPNDDPDQFIRTDLPYACDAAFSPTVAAFRGPTRAVGRLPDLVGDADADLLVDLLRQARTAAPIAAATPTPVFALSTKTWKVSTRLTLQRLAGASGTVLTCPPRGPAWTATDLAPALHLVNCHGAEFDPRWYGEARAGQDPLPVSMDASTLPGLVARGTVVAAECCYGTGHWPPAAASGQGGMAVTLLRESAAGVFGSANVSYGPASANEYADIICQLFLSEVLAGASLGRAALSARQRFVQGESFLDPTDLKTLGQFNLLGDPSLHPLARPDGPGMAAVPAGVGARRGMLNAVGHGLAASAIVSNDTPRARAGVTRDRMAELLGYPLPPGVRVRSYDTQPRQESALTAGAAPVRQPVAHVAFVPPVAGQGRSVVIVRAEPGAPTEVRVVVPR